MSSFSITIRAENFDDALDIYSRVLNTPCRYTASAQLAFKNEKEVRILSTDEVKQWGNGYAGENREIHAV